MVVEDHALPVLAYNGPGLGQTLFCHRPVHSSVQQLHYLLYIHFVFGEKLLVLVVGLFLWAELRLA